MGLDVVVGLFLLVLGLAAVTRFGMAWGAVGIWLNLGWLVFENQWGMGWMTYLHGLGIATVLATGYRQYALVWALLPWPLLLLTRLDVQTLLPYVPSWGEGLMLGVVAYLVTGVFRRP